MACQPISEALDNDMDGVMMRPDELVPHVQVNGEWVPVADLVWLGIAPCGCVEGISRVEHVLSWTKAESRLLAGKGRSPRAAKLAGWRVELVRNGDPRADRIKSFPNCGTDNCPYVKRAS